MQKEVLSNLLELLRKEIDTRAFLDSDYATNKVNRRLRTGHMMFLNNLLTLWLSKLQGSIETLVLGSEFIATKHIVDTLKCLYCKLKIMEVPLSGPSLIYGVISKLQKILRF